MTSLTGDGVLRQTPIKADNSCGACYSERFLKHDHPKGVNRLVFQSILFESDEPIAEADKNVSTPPDFFHDLNLDQIIDTMLTEAKNFHLKPFFYIPLKRVSAIKYRHEIFQDLEKASLFESIRSFSEKMEAMRRTLTMIESLCYKYHKEGWFLEAVESYCEAVNGLVIDLSSENLKSRGLKRLLQYLRDYAGSSYFTSLFADTKKLKAALSAVKYCILIKDNLFKIQKYDNEIDYAPEIEKTFARFKQQTAKDYRIHFPGGTGMNHITAKILDFVAKLYPDIFSSLDAYCQTYAGFLNEKIDVFEREVQFYIAYLSYMEIFKRYSLPFCYPNISDSGKDVYNQEGFDLALAQKCIQEKIPIVCNDFHLKGNERLFVVSGPNQGGKTTFARTFGQLHYLACLGCPVPGRSSQLFLFDQIFTHFEKQEKFENQRG